MIEYGVEMSAIVARIEQREKALSDRIIQIQQDAHASVMSEIRRAEDELLPARFLLKTMEQLLSDDRSKSTADPMPPVEPSKSLEITPTTPRRATASPARMVTKKAGKKTSKASKETALDIMMALLDAAPSGVASKEIDEKVVSKGLKIAAARKARYLAQKRGTITVVGGKLVLAQLDRPRETADA